MKKILIPSMVLVMLLQLAGLASAAPLTIDDIPADLGLRFYDRYGFCFLEPFEAVTHTDGAWWTPRSGQKVAACKPGEPASVLQVVFKAMDPITVHTVGAYFSTQQNVVIRMSGYVNDKEHLAAAVDIGADGTAWANHYAQIAAPDSNITFVEFTAVSAPDALQHFCMDDIKIEPASSSQ